MSGSAIDVVGLGLNAVDTTILVRRFPALGGKEHTLSVTEHAGGQVATALVTCQRLGLRTRYIGKVGGDREGRSQLNSLRSEGVDLRYARMVRHARTQFAYIIVDQRSGERTVLWSRDPRLRLLPSDFPARALSAIRALHIDGCDHAASLAAARWSRRAGVPVVADLDTVYENVQLLLPHIDYLIASTNFLASLTGEVNAFRAIERAARELGVRTPGMTLGRYGALILHDGRFEYSPGFVVEATDTTGAGDVFHGAFIYGLLQGWPMSRTLDFSNAMAALNCTALGARGKIATAKEAEELVHTGKRHLNHDYAPKAIKQLRRNKRKASRNR